MNILLTESQDGGEDTGELHFLLGWVGDLFGDLVGEDEEKVLGLRRDRM
jgi:hypothetical protein